MPPSALSHSSANQNTHPALSANQNTPPLSANEIHAPPPSANQSDVSQLSNQRETLSHLANQIEAAFSSTNEEAGCSTNQKPARPMSPRKTASQSSAETIGKMKRKSESDLETQILQQEKLADSLTGQTTTPEHGAAHAQQKFKIHPKLKTTRSFEDERPLVEWEHTSPTAPYQVSPGSLRVGRSSTSPNKSGRARLPTLDDSETEPSFSGVCSSTVLQEPQPKPSQEKPNNSSSSILDLCFDTSSEQESSQVSLLDPVPASTSSESQETKKGSPAKPVLPASNEDTMDSLLDLESGISQESSGKRPTVIRSTESDDLAELNTGFLAGDSSLEVLLSDSNATQLSSQTLSSSGTASTGDTLVDPELGSHHDDNKSPSQSTTSTSAKSLDSPGPTSLDPPGRSSLESIGQSSLDPPGRSSLDSPGESSLDPSGRSSLDSPGQSSPDPPGQSSPDPPGRSSLDPPGPSSGDEQTIETPADSVVLPSGTSENEAPGSTQRRTSSGQLSRRKSSHTLIIENVDESTWHQMSTSAMSLLEPQDGYDPVYGSTEGQELLEGTTSDLEVHWNLSYVSLHKIQCPPALDNPKPRRSPPRFEEVKVPSFCVLVILHRLTGKQVGLEK